MVHACICLEKQKRTQQCKYNKYNELKLWSSVRKKKTTVYMLAELAAYKNTTEVLGSQNLVRVISWTLGQ